MNNWTIAGHIGKDAEQRYTGNGESIVNFNVAIDNGKKDGQPRKPTWVRVAMWGERWEKLVQFLTKGKSVTVSGRADVEKPWQNKNGDWFAGLILNASQLTFQSGGQKSEGDEEATARRTAAPSSSAPEISDEDIPF